jgi:hypothetical protein
MPIFRDYSQTNRTAENGLFGSEAVTVPAFLWRAHVQSGFEGGIRRKQCDHNPGIRPCELTFVSALETEFGASHKSVSGQYVREQIVTSGLPAPMVRNIELLLLRCSHSSQSCRVPGHPLHSVPRHPLQVVERNWASESSARKSSSAGFRGPVRGSEWCSKTPSGAAPPARPVPTRRPGIG